MMRKLILLFLCLSSVLSACYNLNDQHKGTANKTKVLKKRINTEVVVFRLTHTHDYPAKSMVTAIALIGNDLYYFKEDFRMMTYKKLSPTKGLLLNNASLNTLIQSTDFDVLRKVDESHYGCKAETENEMIIRFNNLKGKGEFIFNEIAMCDENSPAMVIQKLGEVFTKNEH